MRSALHLAVCENQISTVKWLLEHEASANIADVFHNTALEDAIRID